MRPVRQISLQFVTGVTAPKSASDLSEEIPSLAAVDSII
jgi:hypothetical protein